MSGKTKPGLAARAAAWIPAALLALLLAVTVLILLLSQALTSGTLHAQSAAADSVVDSQMARIAARVGELAEDYSFSAEDVMENLSRDSIQAMNQEMAGWYTRIITEGVVGEVPSWSAEDILPAITDTLDVSVLEEEEDPDGIANEIGSAIEKTVRDSVMPVRQALVALGVKTLRNRVDIPSAVRLFSQSSGLCGAACLLLAGLIALLTAPRFRISLKYYGAALAGAGIAVLFALVFTLALNIPGLIRQASEILAGQLSILQRTVLLECGGISIGMTVLGYLCLIMYRRAQGGSE